MLSEVIHSELSYSALPLAGQPIHQRFVHFGPLVAFFPSHEERRLYLHPFCTIYRTNFGCWRITGIGCRFQRNDSSLCKSVPPEWWKQVVTGSIPHLRLERLPTVLTSTHNVECFGPQSISFIKASTVISHIVITDFSVK